MKLKPKALSLFLLCLLSQSYAATDFVIKQIKITGLQRIEMGTVYNYLPVKVGDTLTTSKSDDILHKLYNTGFFQDIRLEEQGGTLLIDVEERPVIAKLAVTGDHEFDHDKLIKSLKENGLSDGLIFDQSILDSAIMALKTEYYNRGLYSVIVTPKVTTLERNRVNIEVGISEGVTAKIGNIYFTGNKKFSSHKLQSQMFLTTGNWLSFWYKDNQYSSDKLNGDLETVKAFYQNQGYITYRLNSVQVQLAPDKKKVYITINIDEGKQYRYKYIKLSGDFKDVPSKELNKLITVKANQIVNQEKLEKDIQALKLAVGKYGYAFASVNPVPDIDNQNDTVGYTLFLDPGKKIYVRSINISGNVKTRDVVIRRELRQEEASIYNAEAIKRSKERIDVLGYFKNTDISTAAVPDVNDQVDLNLNVTETNTSSINFGLGVAQGQGLIVNGGISQPNLFGSGKSLSFNGSTSQLYSNISASFTDPYFLVNGTSLGYAAYVANSTPNLVGISQYSTQTIGARVSTSVPVSEYDRINFSLGFENNQISINNSTAPQRFIQFTHEYGDTVNAVPFTISWGRNTTDSTLWPTSGGTYSNSFTITAPGVGAQYYKFDSIEAWYFPISQNLTWKTNGEFGFINSYGAGQVVPFYQNFLEGGPNSIRGYYIGSIGPKDTDGSSLGGTRWAFISNNLLLPMPGIKDDKTVRLSAFYDIGTLFGGNPYDLSWQQSVRASYGVGLTWLSPMGPIQLSFAVPMFNQPADNIQSFQFTFGTSF